MYQLKVIVMTGLVASLVPLEILGVTGLSATGLSATGWDRTLEHYFTASAKPIRTTGGRRGVCDKTQSSEPLAVFLPAAEAGEIAMDTTSHNTPSLYFYIPDRSEDINSPVLRLREEREVKPDDGVIAPMKITLPKTPGLLKIQLPKALEKGKSYKWALSLRCKEGTGIKNLSGVVSYQELSPQVTGKLAKAISVKEKAAVYIQEGLWLDAVDLFMEDSELRTKSFDEISGAIGLERPAEALSQDRPVPVNSEK